MRTVAGGGASDGASVASLEQVRVRLEHLYEIGKLYATFENVEQTLDPALVIVAKTLPLRSAVLIEEDGRSKMTVWAPDVQDPAHMSAARQRAAAAYAYLIGASNESLGLGEAHLAATPMPRQAEGEGALAPRFILIPLVVANHSPFGALQLEGARPVDKADLMFVNAIANQLAIALDRDRSRRREVARREHAEALAVENARLYEEAQHAVRVREHILAIVSHDLKNPLGAIMMTAETLARGGGKHEPPGPEVVQAVGRIRRATERIGRIIGDLLDFASIETGNLAIARQPCDPGPILDETLASFEGIAQKKQQRLTVQVEPDLPKVYCDRDRILQVLSNLVGNATAATPAQGTIRLRAEKRGEGVLFAVSDSGPGIGQDDLAHLFERYWRSGEAQYEGQGLGLAIVKGIIDAHRGRIWVESARGSGATFFFTVPVASTAGGSPAGPPGPSPG